MFSGKFFSNFNLHESKEMSEALISKLLFVNDSAFVVYSEQGLEREWHFVLQRPHFGVTVIISNAEYIANTKYAVETHIMINGIAVSVVTFTHLEESSLINLLKSHT